jgi:hypothetical protein
MKPSLALPLALASTVAAQWPNFRTYNDCVAYCNNDPTCESAFWDTFSGNCEYHACVYGETAPTRFSSYIKPSATGYCSGTAPTATTTRSTARVTASTTPSAAASAATQTGGASPGSKALSRFDSLSAAAAAWAAMRLLVG